jgi:hypothetical protein
MNASIGAEQAIVLVVGEEFHLGFGRDRIIYAGMPSEEVYSIAERKAVNQQGYAWNLFYPKSRREVTIDGVKLHVERVTPDEIAFSLA